MKTEFNGFKDEKAYIAEILAIKQELKTMPDGYLVKRGPHYYVRANGVDKGITKTPEKIKLLARKAYLLRRINHIEWNYSLVEKLPKLYKTEEPIEIIRGLSSFYHSLPDSYFFHFSAQGQRETLDGEQPEHWESFAKRKMEHREIAVGGIAGRQDGLIYLTNSGIRVRSKSERTIADALDHDGVPYHYEAALALGGESRYPDFTIYRPFDGKMILWEHFGLMNDDVYRQKANDKLALYARYGYHPFNNLICTYEQDLQDPRWIQGIIEMFLKR